MAIKHQTLKNLIKITLNSIQYTTVIIVFKNIVISKNMITYLINENIRFS